MALFILFLSEALQAFQDLGVQKRQPAQNLARIVPGATQQWFIASPWAPLRKFLPKRPSAFMCPITGSTALRRLSFFLIAVVTPRLAPAIHTFSPSRTMP